MAPLCGYLHMAKKNPLPNPDHPDLLSFVAASLPIPLPSKTPLHQVPPAYQLRILRVILYEYKRVIFDERQGGDAWFFCVYQFM